jgi:hypothetical protein
MPLILAIEPDPRQAAQIAVIARRVGAELMLADTTQGALDVIGDRVPDLVLAPALLSPQDDAALAAALRVIAAAAHVRTLTIPVLSAGPKRPRAGGMLAKLRRLRAELPAPDGCDPAIFAEQISVYLKEAADERAALALAAAADDSAPGPAQAVHVPDPPQAAYLLETPLAAYVLETPQAAYASEPPQAIYAPEPPHAAYALGTPPATSSVDTPEASVKAEPVQAASESIAPTRSVAVPSTVFEAPSFFAEAPAAAVEETKVIRAELVRAEEEPVPVADEPELSYELLEATGRDLDLSEPREDEAEEGAEEGVEEELVFELTLDDADVMLFDAPATPRIDAPAVTQVAGPPVASNELTTANRQPPGDAKSLHDERSAERATIEEFEAASADELAAPEEHVTPPARHTEHWMPMSSGIERLWPPLEGVVSEFAEALELLDEADGGMESVPNVEAAAMPLLPIQTLSAGPPPVDAPKSEWVELIDSLRKDIERLRATPPQPAPPPASQPVAVPSDEAVTASKAKRRAKPSHPVQDEWGFFDPEQCGFAALLAKLDEMTENGDETEAGGN